MIPLHTPLMRSKLFVPASRPELFPKALSGEADSLSFDLEDAVAEEGKEAARLTLSAALASPEFATSTKILIVRVNAVSTPHFAADLAAVIHPRLDFLNLPKVGSADEIRAVAAAIGRLEQARGITRPIQLLANIESPRGLRLASEIASADSRVAGLQLGFADLFEPLGLDRTDAAAVRQIQLAVRLAAGEAGIWAYDAAYGAIKDPEGFQTEALTARRLGFLGKTCIHPSQIPLANDVFRPSEDEITFAQRVVEAADHTTAGVFSLEGRMIDAPFIRRARAIVEIARQMAAGKP